ncbi:hypothetical protein OHU10_41965 [Streptomyces europaeiscabiei]|nr:hypothetical protein [Streptomyces europaeiscabiei]
MTVAVARYVVPATVPFTSKVPGSAYCPGSTGSQVTPVRLSLEPSL